MARRAPSSGPSSAGAVTRPQRPPAAGFGSFDPRENRHGQHQEASRKKASHEKGCDHVLEDGIGDIRRAAT
jgi:hypothetical protein